ncbi:hypothetical protein [Frankia sp. Cas4]|uniref:hypothetical protein n=1 Tax=Frankia sp. Cas4 TaxID=3073927 RepID=UPI002AD27F81|nr:hypothetical protein [Frankia sp. Cas4]
MERGELPRSVRLSLAQTARWLTTAGIGERQPAREIHPEAHLVTLPGAARPVHVVGPPGRIGDLVPGWAFITDLGIGPAAFTGVRTAD